MKWEATYLSNLAERLGIKCLHISLKNARLLFDASCISYENELIVSGFDTKKEHHQNLEIVLRNLSETKLHKNEKTIIKSKGRVLFMGMGRNIQG